MSASPHKDGAGKQEADSIPLQAHQSDEDLRYEGHQSDEDIEVDDQRQIQLQGQQHNQLVEHSQQHREGEDENMLQGHPATHEQASLYETDVKEQDRWLPIANVARIMKQALPDNAKIAKEAKECMQECVSEFISFITSEASEKCQAEKRKTVNGEDIIFAMTSLGFENYSEALRIYLVRYRETNLSKSDNQQANRPSSGYDASANPAPGLGGDATDELESAEGLEGQPAFGGAQEPDSNGTSFPYPSQAISNGGGGPY